MEGAIGTLGSEDMNDLIFTYERSWKHPAAEASWSKVVTNHFDVDLEKIHRYCKKCGHETLQTSWVNTIR